MFDFRDPLFRGKALRIALVAIVAVHIAIPLATVVSGTLAITSTLTIDDSFYYLLTAWHAANNGIVSFDTINTTNGVQFVWFCLLYILSLMSGSKESLLDAAIILSIACSTLPYFLFPHLGRLTGVSRPQALSVILAVSWFTVCQLNPRFAFGAMDSSLHGLVAWAVIVQAIIVTTPLLDQHRPSNSSLMLLAILLVLNAWTRLDSGVLSAVLSLPLLYAIFGGAVSRYKICIDEIKQSLRRHYYIFIIIIVAAFIQFGFFYLSGGTVMPVSAMVKDEIFSQSAHASFPAWAFLLWPFNYANSDILSVIGVVCFFIMILAIGFAAAANRLNKAFAIVIGLAAAGIVVHALLISHIFLQYYFWYLSWNYVYWCIGSSLLIYAVLALLPDTPGVRVLPAGLAAVAIAAVITASVLLRSPSDFYAQRMAAARWIRENTPPDAIIGAWNAGQLGYFSDRRVVNLDGLINSKRYLELVLRNPAYFRTYMQETGITYLADYAFGFFKQDLEENGGFDVVKTFALSPSLTLQVLKVRPDGAAAAPAANPQRARLQIDGAPTRAHAAA